jgi:predicted metalloendopeptidase
VGSASDLTYVIDVETPTFFSNLSLLVPFKMPFGRQRAVASRSAHLMFATQLDDTQDFSVWETYLRWAVLNQLAPSLSQDFVDANFNFFGMIYSGIPARTAACPCWP